MQRKHAAASVTRCTIHLPPTAVGEGDYGIPCAGQSQGSPISHRSIWESLRHSESGTHLLGVHAELEITLANGHMYIHIQGFINKTRAATLSYSQSFINKTGAATLSFQPSLSTSTFKQIYIPSRRTRAFSTSSGISPLLAPTRSSRTELDRRPSWPSLWTTHAWAGTCILWRNNSESFLSSFQTIQKYVFLYLYRLFRPFTYTE